MWHISIFCRLMRNGHFVRPQVFERVKEKMSLMCVWADDCEKCDTHVTKRRRRIFQFNQLISTKIIQTQKSNLHRNSLWKTRKNTYRFNIILLFGMRICLLALNKKNFVFNSQVEWTKKTFHKISEMIIITEKTLWHLFNDFYKQ